MTSHDDQVRALLTEAMQMPTSLGKFEVIAEAVRLADLHNDVPLGVAARLPLLVVADSLLRDDAMAVAFTWWLHQYDTRPELFGGRNLFREYRTLIGRMANFDTVSRAQLKGTLADLTDRLTRAGQSPGHALYAKLVIGPNRSTADRLLPDAERPPRLSAAERAVESGPVVTSSASTLTSAVPRAVPP